MLFVISSYSNRVGSIPLLDRKGSLKEPVGLGTSGRGLVDCIELHKHRSPSGSPGVFSFLDNITWVALPVTNSASTRLIVTWLSLISPLQSINILQLLKYSDSIEFWILSMRYFQDAHRNTKICKLLRGSWRRSPKIDLEAGKFVDSALCRTEFCKQ